MGQQAIYKCNKCSNEFKSREGGGFVFREYRCVNCDTIKSVPDADAYKIPPETYKKEIGLCEKCYGELRDDLKPMCTKCKSREVSEVSVLEYYD